VEGRRAGVDKVEEALHLLVRLQILLWSSMLWRVRFTPAATGRFCRCGVGRSRRATSQQF
jgi:hypothetical protein